MRRTATVVGSGPNGLSAAIVLARAGLDVEVREAAAVPGGSARSGELTLPGFIHDLGSAVHPMAISSPFFSDLNLPAHGVRWIWPEIQLAHPLDDGTAVLVSRDVAETASQFPSHDAAAYRRIFTPLVDNWPALMRDLLGPLRLPRHPWLMAKFGINAIQPAAVFAMAAFRNNRAQALFAGMAAHSFLKLEAPLSAAFGLMLGGSAHAAGWPVPEGGSGKITQALTAILSSYRGQIVTDSRVASLSDFPPRDLTLCDVTPRQFLPMVDQTGSNQATGRPFREMLSNYRYGPGVFKVDWALREPIPWTAKDCLRSATVHLGGTLEEIAASERDPWAGEPPDWPFVLLAQPSLFDPTRAPAGQHTAWAYCHVPNGWRGSALDQIEAQIERFAPGFRECVLARAVRNTAQMEAWNENLVGGDINGGAATLHQFVLRPTWRRYGTPYKGVFLCSSSTPPGGGVHGMCGYWAANWALKTLPRPVRNH